MKSRIGMRKRFLIITILVSVFFGFLVGLFVGGPYQLHSEGGTLVRVNRITGTTWLLGYQGWIKLDAQPEITERPPPIQPERPPDGEKLVSPTIEERLEIRGAGHDPDRAMRILGTPQTNSSSPMIEVQGSKDANGNQLIKRFRILDGQ
jgi:hypothetical protein